MQPAIEKSPGGSIYLEEPSILAWTTRPTYTRQTWAWRQLQLVRSLGFMARSSKPQGPAPDNKCSGDWQKTVTATISPPE